MRLFIRKWYPVILAFVCMMYSVTLGLLGRQEEALYSAHWPGTKKGCVMIRHLIEDDCWSKDRLIRQLNFGKLEMLRTSYACS